MQLGYGYSKLRSVIAFDGDVFSRALREETTITTITTFNKRDTACSRTKKNHQNKRHLLTPKTHTQLTYRSIPRRPINTTKENQHTNTPTWDTAVELFTHRIRLAVRELPEVSLRGLHEAVQVVLRPPGEQVLAGDGAVARLLRAAQAGHVHVAAGAGNPGHEEGVLAVLAHALHFGLLLIWPAGEGGQREENDLGRGGSKLVTLSHGRWTNDIQQQREREREERFGGGEEEEEETQGERRE